VPPSTSCRRRQAINGWKKRDWGRPVKVDKTFGQVSADDYHAIVLPAGQINPDLLRVKAWRCN
jgi:protease I